jgi:hypothetical protein
MDTHNVGSYLATLSELAHSPTPLLIAVVVWVILANTTRDDAD